jgi:hypothetical protein
MSMKERSLKRFLALVFIATALTGCGEQRNAAVGNPQGAVGLEDIQSTIASATGYPKDALELLASPVHLRISISDGKLAQSNQTDRENAATAIVIAAEQALTSRTQFASLQVISVAIIHPAQMEGSDRDSHTEDVLEFRKGPNQRFSHHIT